MKRKLQSFAIGLIVVFTIFSSQDIFSQTQRNPVLEEATGTWCVWCPCGHTIMAQIKAAMPNAILIGYHGDFIGYSRDPFQFPEMDQLMGNLGLRNSFPSGVIDRVSGVQGRNAWTGLMNTRNSVPATVAIDVERSFNELTREFSATIDFTALTNLNGQYKFNVILLEDGIVWNQAGNSSCPGNSNYVHKHLVRDLMNGALGEEIINGTWNANDVITKTVSHIVQTPTTSVPDMVWDSCNVVVLAYKVGSPLSSGAEIQQAVEMELISPDYVVTLTSSSGDVIIDKSGIAEFTAVVQNEGLLDDTYYVDVNMDAPTGWSSEFTTPHGTFPAGHRDSVDVLVGDTLAVDVSVLPNVLNGFGEVTVQFTSKNDPNIFEVATFRLVTTTGVPGLVIDASGEGYANFLSDAMDQEFEYPYGIVNREALNPSVDLANFTFISWSTGNAYPVFIEDEVNALMPFLDNGGRLLINGQNIGEDIFGASGQSQFAQNFYNNYLHANYVSTWGLSYFFNGLAGDPIGDQLNFPINSVYERSPDEFVPFDASATSIFKFGTLAKYNSIRADDGVDRVVYIGFGFEQIDDTAKRDTIITRSVRWLMDGIVLNNPKENQNVTSFNLSQNYPNPFNPSTTLTYSIPDESNVSLKIYDVMGREIVELVNERQSAGSHVVKFDASSLASGTYFYKLTASGFVSVKKMTLLK